MWTFFGTQCRQSGKDIGTRTVSKLHKLWRTNSLKGDRHFYPPSVNFAFCFTARLRTRRSANKTQPPNFV